MKKYLSIILALVMVLTVFAACSKGGGGGTDPEKTTAAKLDIPDGYQSFTFDNTFYGLRVTFALPAFDGIEEEDRTDSTSVAYHSYDIYSNADEYEYATLSVMLGVTNEYLKESEFEESEITVETTTIDGKESSIKDFTPVRDGEKDIEFHIFDTYLDGFAEASFELDMYNDEFTEEQWNEMVTAIKTYTTFEILNENGLSTSDGKMMDNSNTMAFANPATIMGESVELKQTINGICESVVAEFTLDGIKHTIYSEGDVTDSMFEARVEKEDEYPAFTSGDYTYYCHMVNRYPNVECDVYVEIDGVYYEFYIYRDHNLDVDANKAYVEDSANGQFFADLTNDFVSNATIDTTNYLG